MLIAMAYAQDGGGLGGGGALVQLLPLILIFVVFYFLLIRPQQKKAKDHREMLKNLKRGDKVLTGGGFYATIAKLDDDATVTLELAPNLRVRAARHTIADVLSKPEPRKAETADKAGENTDRADKTGAGGGGGGHA